MNQTLFLHVCQIIKELLHFRAEVKPMHDTALHLSTVELEQGLAEVLASPRDTGRLEAIFVRPAPNERRTLAEARSRPKAASTATAGSRTAIIAKRTAAPIRAARFRS